LTRQRRLRKGWKRLTRSLGRSRAVRWLRQHGAAPPTALRIAVVVVALLTAIPLVNLLYQVARKPTELWFFAGQALDKQPADTWRQYGARFRAFSTDTISPELLAALAQTESSGNPVARTYWRWRLGWNPANFYRPASSAVGLFQMTDPAFEEASRYCIRGHRVVQDGCWFTSLYARTLPAHAIELTAIYLDRQVASVLATARGTAATAPQKQDLAAFIHLCGARPARGFLRRGFRLRPGERCGDHLVATYLGKVNAMKRQFLRFAANEP
jgi:hypothetical protein